MKNKSISNWVVNLRRSVFTTDVPEAELAAPTFSTVLKVVWNIVRTFPMERTGQIIGSAFFLLMLWGYHGNLELLNFIVPGWVGPGVDIGTRPQIIPGVLWDNELISFWGGAILVVVIPILLIKFVFRQKLADYGLGLPPEGRRKLALTSFLGLTLICIPAFLVATNDAGMRATYPFYRPFPTTASFILYELTYLPFFIAIEFIFRGYLLFGLAGVRDLDARVRRTEAGVPGAFYFGKYALLIQMLSYTAWHLGKPLPELWGTLFWGLAAGVLAYITRSIWPVVASHWLLNVFFDAVVAFGS
jgi:hypothetical protein